MGGGWCAGGNKGGDRTNAAPRHRAEGCGEPCPEPIEIHPHERPGEIPERGDDPAEGPREEEQEEDREALRDHVVRPEEVRIAGPRGVREAGEPGTGDRDEDDRDPEEVEEEDGRDDEEEREETLPAGEVLLPERDPEHQCDRHDPRAAEDDLVDECVLRDDVPGEQLRVVAERGDEAKRKGDDGPDEGVAEGRDEGKGHVDQRRYGRGPREPEDDRVSPDETFHGDREEGKGEDGERRVQEIVFAEKGRHLGPEVEHDAAPAGDRGIRVLPGEEEDGEREECAQDEEVAHDGTGNLRTYPVSGLSIIAMVPGKSVAWVVLSRKPLADPGSFLRRE